MSQYRFIATGNYVDFYDGSMHVIKLHNTSRCVTWLFDNTPGINFKIDEMIYYHTDDLSDISFDDVACATQADFVTGIQTMFPGLAGGGGPGATPGIDDVLGQEQTVTSRFIELGAGGFFEIITTGSRNLLELDTTANAEKSSLEANNVTGLGNSSKFLSSTTDLISETLISASFNDGEKAASILGHADASGSSIVHSADVHTFNTGGQENGKISLDQSFLMAFNANSNVGIMGVNVNAEQVNGSFTADFNNGAKIASIEPLADATTSSLTYTADHHIFATVQVFADNAAAVTGGLAVGTLYRTGDALKIVHA